MRQARQPTAIRTRQAETYGYDARADFEAAWKVFLPNRTEADFQAWRDQEAWTAEKYRRFDRGECMPHDWRPGA
jgi:pullulanase/glycogen debranching enzyme